MIKKRSKQQKQITDLFHQSCRYQETSIQPAALQKFAKSFSSQNGEDGMIQEALGRLGIEEPKFVEIGASDGHQNCTRHLLEQGAKGLWVEGNLSLVENARRTFGHLSIDIRHQMVNRDNIVSTIKSSEIVREGFDLLVVDIDGNDWWITKEILNRYKPSLLVTEYNPAHGPKKKWIMPYDPLHQWEQDQNYGASLSSYNKLLKRFGYRLIACDPQGVNAFWVHKEQCHLFSSTNSPKHHFCPAAPMSMHPPKGTWKMEEILTELQLNQIDIGDPYLLKSKKYKNCFAIVFEIKNLIEEDMTISSFGTVPLRLGLRWNGGNLSEPTRIAFTESIPSGASSIGISFHLNVLNEIEVAVVQEGVAWGTWRSFNLLKSKKIYVR